MVSLIHGTLILLTYIGKSIGPGIRAATFLVTEGHLFYTIILVFLTFKEDKEINSLQCCFEPQIRASPLYTVNTM